VARASSRPLQHDAGPREGPPLNDSTIDGSISLRLWLSSHIPGPDRGSPSNKKRSGLGPSASAIPPWVRSWVARGSLSRSIPNFLAVAEQKRRNSPAVWFRR